MRSYDERNLSVPRARYEHLARCEIMVGQVGPIVRHLVDAVIDIEEIAASEALEHPEIEGLEALFNAVHAIGIKIRILRDMIEEGVSCAEG